MLLVLCSSASQVVNNDGLHGMVKRSGSKILRAGQHVSFSVTLLTPISQRLQKIADAFASEPGCRFFSIRRRIRFDTQMVRPRCSKHDTRAGLCVSMQSRAINKEFAVNGIIFSFLNLNSSS
jgi:hypothetical protein